MIGYEKINLPGSQIHNKFIFNTNEYDENCTVLDICIKFGFNIEKTIEIIKNCGGKRHKNFDYYYFETEDEIVSAITTFLLLKGN